MKRPPEDANSSSGGQFVELKSGSSAVVE